MANITRLTGTGNRKAGDRYRAVAGETTVIADFTAKRGGRDVWLLLGGLVEHVGSLSDLADEREAARIADLMAAIPASTEHTREAWLLAAVEVLRPRFAEVGLPLPEKVHVSVGFGGNSRAESANVLGVCWARRASDDGVNHIFISPELGDTARILDVLIHELIHAADDCASGHRGAFAEAATRLGLEGKMTATVASLPLAAEMIVLAEELGTYPHGALSGYSARRAPKTPGDGGEALPPVSSGPKGQGTRMLKVMCPADGYTVRTTAKWLAIGLPTCPCGTEMERA